MVTVNLSDEEAEVVIRALETGKASSGERRFVLIPLIESIKSQKCGAGNDKES